jgi:hypothetical protein
MKRKKTSMALATQNLMYKTWTKKMFTKIELITTQHKIRSNFQWFKIWVICKQIGIQAQNGENNTKTCAKKLAYEHKQIVK